MAPALPPHPAPPPRRSPGLRHDSGQASIDYAALLTFVAIALAGAGAAVGLDGVPRGVVHAVRTGLCIVGGDVCRPADAAADGLAPCLTAEDAEGRGLTVTILSVRLGRRTSLTVAQRSDGSVLVTRLDADSVGLAGGVGVELGPVVDVGASATFDLSLAHGSAWELASTADAAALLAAIRRGDDPPVPPTWNFGDLGGEATGEIGVSLPGATLTALEASAGAAEGMRTGRGETTLYIRAHADASSTIVPLRDALTGRSARAEGAPGSVTTAARGTSSGPDGRGAPLLLGITRDAHGLRELSFRRATRGSRAGEVVETVGRLDLREPANRTAAAPLLSARLPWPPAVAAHLRAVLRRTARAGTIERAVYAVEDRSHDYAAALKLGVALGLSYAEVDVRRRLVAASAWTAGSPERVRADCLPDLG